MATPEQIALQEALKQLTEQTTEAQLESSEKRIKQLEKEKEFLDEQAALGKTIVGRAKEAYDLDEEKLERRKLLIKLGRAELDDTKEKIKEEERLLDIKRQGYNDAEGFAKRFMGITREPSSEFGKFLVDPSARLEGLSKGLGEVVDGMSIMTSTVDKVVETTVKLALEQDQAVVSFRKATGASGEFDDNIRGLERSLFTAGVTAGEASQAVQSLFGSVTDFTQMSEQQQKVLSETVAVLNELGVSSETTAKNIQFSTKVLGQSTNQAAALQRELFTFAQELGVSADKIASDFGQFGDEIAALGANGVDAFRDLQVAAKSLGMEMGELLNLTKQFDRFDTAAESVGRLNALLGGPFLNAVQMVSVTDPAERLRLLKQGIDRAGISFDQMDYYQRKALASATGLGEAQLAMLMRGDLNLVKEPVKSAKELAELEMQTREFNTVMEELAQIGRSLMISFRPLIMAFKTFTEVIQFLSPLLGPAMLLGSVFAMNKAFIALNTTMRVNPFIAIASAVAMLAQGIYYGFSPSILMVLGLLTTAFVLLAPAALGVMPALLPLAAAFSGIAMAVASLSSVFSSLFSSDLSSNLKIMSAEIATMVDKINELETAKAVEFTSSIQATAVNAQALAQTGATNTPAAAAATTTAAAAPAGPPPTINISLSVDGTEFQTAVNSVEVTNYVNGTKSTLFDSIVNAFINNQVTTRGN